MPRIIVLTLLFGLACASFPEIWMRDVQDSRIINGEDANEGEFPYIASLRYYNVTPGHYCGASILTSKWALTAAHCCSRVLIPEEWYLYVGSIYLSRGGSKHTVEEVISHEDYKPNEKWKNDVCLIKVSEPFVFGKNVQQATLVSENTKIENGTKVTVAGWGRTTPVAYPDRLQKGANFYALSNEECKKRTGVEMFGGYICATGCNKDQCTWTGDSGTPLSVDGAQIGTVSFGFRPYGNGRPTVYARVSYFVNWIKKSLGADASQLKIRQ